MRRPWRVVIEVICPDDTDDPEHRDIEAIVRWGYVVDVTYERLYAEKELIDLQPCQLAVENKETNQCTNSSDTAETQKQEK